MNTEKGNGKSASKMNGHSHSIEGLARRLPDAVKALRRSGVAYVRIDYSGAWDQGRVEDPRYYTADMNLMNPPLPLGVRRELRTYFAELLELRYPGWANAEGSRGEFECELIRDQLTHLHGWRYYSYDYHGMQGL